MSERRPSSEKGDVAARQLKETLIASALDKTGIELPRHQTLDQLVRSASKIGIKIGIYCYKE